MADIAVMIIDPGNNRFPQLVDDDFLIRNLIPVLVGRLALPRELNYELILAGTEVGLPFDQSLGSSAIKAGANLYLTPVRDTLFTAIIDRLYEEAKKHADDKLWTLAKQKLDQVFRSFPEHPDPDGLKSLIIDYPPGGTANVPGAAAAPLVRASATRASRPAVATSKGMRRGTIGCLLILVGFGVAGFIFRAEVRQWWQKNPKNADKGVQEAQDAYGVYVGGGNDEVIVGRMSVIMDTPTNQLDGWGLDDTTKVKDTGSKFRMMRGPFNTADQARKAYESEKIPGTERTLPNGGSTVNKFRFDGKEHKIDNATRMLK